MISISDLRIPDAVSFPIYANAPSLSIEASDEELDTFLWRIEFVVNTNFDCHKTGYTSREFGHSLAA